MLSHAEQKLYYWLANTWARGAGDVVDLGSFLGGSTARLAEGRIKAGHKPQIHDFDRFEAKEETKQQVFYDRGIEPFEGSDSLPTVQRLLQQYSPHIKFHKGWIENLGWTGQPIEIL